ncbi:MAG: Sec-independent protein translocase protein TatB [Pseudomonadota bacterium]
MFDIGWSELLVIGVVALIVVGPKDLPKLFRTLGEFTGKARRMAREFQSAMNQAADDTGMGDIAKDMNKIANPKQFGMDKIKEATDDLTKWEPDETTGPNTAKLAADRAEAKRKIDEKYAQKAEEKRLKEAAEAAPEQPDAPTEPVPEGKS